MFTTSFIFITKLRFRLTFQTQRVLIGMIHFKNDKINTKRLLMKLARTHVYTYLYTHILSNLSNMKTPDRRERKRKALQRGQKDTL